jgi:YD repeat-containing protein
MDKLKRKIYLDKIIEFMKNDYPLFHNLKLYGLYDQLSEYELNYVLYGIFEKPVKVNELGIFNQNGNEIYYENSDGKWWVKREYDDNGNLLYEENSEGWWVKREYDEYGNKIYYETSDTKKTLYNRL